MGRRPRPGSGPVHEWSGASCPHHTQVIGRRSHPGPSRRDSPLAARPRFLGRPSTSGQRACIAIAEPNTQEVRPVALTSLRPCKSSLISIRSCWSWAITHGGSTSPLWRRWLLPPAPSRWAVHVEPRPADPEPGHRIRGGRSGRVPAGNRQSSRAGADVPLRIWTAGAHPLRHHQRRPRPSPERQGCDARRVLKRPGQPRSSQSRNHRGRRESAAGGRRHAQPRPRCG